MTEPIHIAPPPPAAPSAPHILHVLDHSLPLHSGYSFRTLAILAGQRARGWRTTQVTGPKQSGATFRCECVDGWEFQRTSPASARGRVPGWREWAQIAALEQRLDELVTVHRPDILHAHSPALNAVATLRVGLRHGLPVVYEVRAFWEDAAADQGTSPAGGPRYRLTRALETWALRRVDAVTTICSGLRDDIVARGVAPQRVTVVPNAVDIKRFRLGGAPDPALRMALGLGDARVIGFIGSFYAYEGLDLLLRALPQFLERAPDIRVLLVGGGPCEGALAAQARQLGIADRVVLVGRVPHAEVGRYYDLLDLLVYPRHANRLTDLVTPLKPLEAMAQGRLLVASDVGGHRELIRDGDTGVLFRSGDPAALARAVLGLLAAEASWPALRAAARHFVETERDWAASVARYANVYANARARRP